MRPEFVTSACLAGLNCRYDGGSKPCPQVIALVKSGRAVAVCPESLANLPIPREPCEIISGRILSRDGRDLTDAFEAGARLALQKAVASGCKKAILKARSPSCGFGRIYDGSFSKKLIEGNGIFARKLLDAGFEIWSEESPPDEDSPMAGSK